jgi:hypothetical protein
VLAGDFAKPIYTVLEFNMTSNIAALSSIDTTSNPAFNIQHSTTIQQQQPWFGQFGYIFGGMGRVAESDGNFYPSHMIIR